MSDPRPAQRRATRAETARARRLRPAGFDDLGLKRAMGDRLLPALVGAMTFLAALALAGFVAAYMLGARWQHGAGSSLTVQVPQPGAPSATTPAIRNRRDAAIALLRNTKGVASARPLTDAELSDLLRPWLGSQAEAMALPLPAVIQVQLDPATTDLPALRRELEHTVPGTLVEDQSAWVDRLAAFARSLQASTGLAFLIVVAVAAAVIAAGTRAGLVARRSAIEIVHGLGATDRYIAARFAARATVLALSGGTIGALTALPILLELAALAAPFQPPSSIDALPYAPKLLSALPAALWIALPCLPFITAAIGWLTAQATVRNWLTRLA